SKAAQMQSDLIKQRNASSPLSNNTTTSSASTNTTTSSSPDNLTTAQQSELDRKANFAEQADKVASKLETEPGSVTKEDGDKMHSREQKAFGQTEKGGLASQAQKQAAENEGVTK
ncbi:MAG: hypothetical protein Q9164_002767, partial [Protoblastenia rupestris]